MASIYNIKMIKFKNALAIILWGLRRAGAFAIPLDWQFQALSNSIKINFSISHGQENIINWVLRKISGLASQRSENS